MVLKKIVPASLDFVSLCVPWVLSRFVYGKGLFSICSSTRPNFFLSIIIVIIIIIIVVVVVVVVIVVVVVVIIVVTRASSLKLNLISLITIFIRINIDIITSSIDLGTIIFTTSVRLLRPFASKTTWFGFQ